MKKIICVALFLILVNVSFAITEKWSYEAVFDDEGDEYITTLIADGNGGCVYAHKEHRKTLKWLNKKGEVIYENNIDKAPKYTDRILVMMVDKKHLIFQYTAYGEFKYIAEPIQTILVTRKKNKVKEEVIKDCLFPFSVTSHHLGPRNASDKKGFFLVKREYSEEPYGWKLIITRFDYK